MKTTVPAPLPRAHLILAQAFISLIMTFLMTGIFTALPSGLAPGWTRLWLMRFLAVWPVAFLLGLIVGPIGFRLAHLALRLASRTRAGQPRALRGSDLRPQWLFARPCSFPVQPVL